MHRAILFVVGAALVMASACGDGSGARPDSGTAGRITVGPGTADWSGRSEIKACAEDQTGAYTVQELTAKLQTPFITAVSLVSPLPASVVAPCPFDYPDGELTVQGPVNAFTYQIYVTDAAEPSAEILEKWQPPGKEEAIPVTFRLRVPASYLQDLGTLLRWFSSVIGPEPTAPR